MSNKREIRKFPDGRICAVTPEVPKGLEGTIAICWTGTPDNLKEEGIPFNRLPPIVTDVPDDWKDSLRDKGFEFDDEPDNCSDCDKKDAIIRKLELDIARFNARKHCAPDKTLMPDIWLILTIFSWVATIMAIFV